MRFYLVPTLSLFALQSLVQVAHGGVLPPRSALAANDVKFGDGSTSLGDTVVARNPGSNLKQETGHLKKRGFAASQARMLMLTARKSDIELQLQFVAQARQQLANLPASEAVQQIDASLAQQQARLEAEHAAVQAEIDAVQAILQKNIEESFKTFG